MADTKDDETTGRALEIRDVGPQVTVQDLGRAGNAHLGVPRSGALDAPAHRLANRLVGNDESAATLECLGGQLSFRTRTAVTIAVTGARVPVTVEGRGQDWGNAVSVPAGSLVELGAVTEGLRAYLAVSGGIEVDPVLGSRSTDLLSGLGPEPVSEGDVLPVGSAGARARSRRGGAHDPAVPRAEAAAGSARGLVRGRRAGGAGRLVVRRGQRRPTASGCASRASPSAGRGRSSCRARGWSWAAYRCHPTGSR